jgi:DNA mismatch repair ATPase MutS
MGLGGHEAAAVAAGALLHYLAKTMQGGLEHVDAIRFYERAGGLALDAVSVRNLELVEPLFSGESVQTTLFHTLDACCTPMGSGCCGLRCCGRRASSARLRRGWTRWVRRRATCDGAKG